MTSTENPERVPGRPTDRLFRALQECAENLVGAGVVEWRLLRSLTLVLTTGCNLRCSYCYADNRSDEEMSWDIARAAIDVLARAGNLRPRIFFYGGEPMLRVPLIRKIVAHANGEYGPEFAPQYVLCTNGTLLDRSILDEIVEQDFRIQLSSDGVRASQDDRGENTFDTIDELLKTLGRNYDRYFRSNVEVKLTLTGANLHRLHESLVYLIGLGVTEITVVPLTTHDPDWRRESHDTLSDQAGRVRRYCLGQRHNLQDVPVRFLRSLNGDSRTKRTNGFHCGVTEGTEIVVEPDGGTVACPAFVRSSQTCRGTLHGQTLQAAFIGSVEDGDFSQKFSNGRERMRLQAIFRKEDGYSSYSRCSECTFAGECFICPSSIAHIPGNTDPHQIPDNQCAFNLVVGRQRELFRREVERRQRPETTRVSPAKLEDKPKI